jgi:hypothetical protein
VETNPTGLLPGTPARSLPAWWVLLAQAIVAAVVLGPVWYAPSSVLPGISGLADLPGTVNLHWLVHERGLLGAAHTRLMMFPLTVDRLVIDGFPLDALASWPFLAQLGWPLGFNLFLTSCFALLGCASAWLAYSWWGANTAALVAGVMAQCNPFLLRELAYGRPTQVFGAIFLPMALVLMHRALVTERAVPAIGAGAAVGLGALAYWFYGFFFGLAIVAMVVLARLDRRPVMRASLLSGGCALGLAALPAAYAMGNLDAHPSASLTWNQVVSHGGEELRLIELLELRDLHAAIQTEGVLGLQLLAFGLCALAILGGRAKRWALPVALGTMALVLAEGPKLQLGNTTLAGPFALLSDIPGLRRLWWPDRALVLLMPAMSLLAGGGAALIARRAPKAGALLAAGLAAALVIEAHLSLPNLPIHTTQATVSQRAELLARGSGPVLILPLGSGSAQPDAAMLTDQIHHGRPLVNGPMPPKSSTAPTAYREFSHSIGLSHFTLCETDHRTAPPIDPSVVFEHLHAHGIHEVYLDMDTAERLYGGAPAYRDCIHRLLPGFRHERGAYLIFNVPD